MIQVPVSIDEISILSRRSESRHGYKIMSDDITNHMLQKFIPLCKQFHLELITFHYNYKLSEENA